VHELEEVCKDSLFGDTADGNGGDNDTAKWDTAKWDIEKELEELKVNYEYLHNKFQRLKKGYDLVIDLTYGYIRPHYRIEKSEYKEQLAESINEKLDDMFWRDD
jgi:SAM-dependent MidA family methyltransferase